MKFQESFRIEVLLLLTGTPKEELESVAEGRDVWVSLLDLLPS